MARHSLAGSLANVARFAEQLQVTSVDTQNRPLMDT
jgi:hypothetical protein